MEEQGTGHITPNWPQLRLLATVALPVVLASCVPASAGDASRLAPGEVAASARPSTNKFAYDAAERERISRRVAELLAPVSAEPAAPFELASQSNDDRARSLDCLTAAIYYEARSEPEDGQRAVAQVVLNRVRHPAFPSSVCGVVFQGSQRRTGCQFSFTCDGSMAHRRQPAAWERSRRIAAEALAGWVYAGVGNATHYHTLAVHPYWASYLRKSAIVGSHIFYRWSGTAGEASAFRQRYGGLEPAPSFAAQTAPSGVTVHSGTPGLWQEDVALDGGTSVTIHRGGTKDPAPVREAVQEAPSEPTPAAAASETTSFGVTVHRG
jgi:spore germination cell wall hydrolase CwlJ-like protein